MEDNRYSKSKVYKIVDENTQHFYIGSTTSDLSKRLYWHKKHNQGNILRHVEKHGFNFKIVLIEEFNLESKIQLLKEEDRIIQSFLNNELCLNINRAYLTEEEKKNNSKIRCRRYKIQNGEKVSDYNKQYHQANLSQIKQRKHDKGREKFKCECGEVICASSKNGHTRSKKHAELLAKTNV